MKIQPLIAVKDVARSSKLYQSLLSLESAHGGDEYEMLTYDGELLLQLHHQTEAEHPGFWTQKVPVSNGVALWFRTDDFESVAKRIQNSQLEIVQDVHINPNANQHEIWFRDYDGHLCVVSNNYGDAE